MYRYLRFIILACATLAAFAIPAMRSAAEQGNQYIPTTQTLDLGNQRMAAGAGQVEYAPVEAVQPFSHLLLRRDAAIPEGASLVLELRTSADGQIWSEWVEVQASEDFANEQDGPNIIWSQLFDVGAIAHFWQVRAISTAAPDGALPVLTQLDVHTVETLSGPANPAPDTGPIYRSGPALSGIATQALNRPGVVSRTAWGSPDGQGSRVPPAYSATTHMVVHHTADSSSLNPGEPNWAARVRAIWSFHTNTRGWGDIGYNYLIDPNGVIYEGRAGGDDAVAFHDTANYGSMGVSLLGTYSTTAPSQATQDSLVSLLAWKASQRGIDPTGSSYYYGCAISSYCYPFNAGSIVPNLAGHRQVTPGHTTCPGDATMALLPGIRERVRQLVEQGKPPAAQLDITGVQFARTTLAVGDLLEVQVTVRNSGQIVASGQAPQVDLNNESATNAHVYGQNECFNGDNSGTVPLFAKESGRVRIVLGMPDWDAQNAGRCNGPTSNYPWRWGLNGELQPGQERTIIGYVQFRTPGTYTLQAGVVQEYVGYTAQGVSPTSITVNPERAAPESAAYNSNLQPMAHVFRLGDQPDDHLFWATNPEEIIRNGYVGSFPWSGESLNWGSSGPFGLTDRFIVLQTRSFNISVPGEYTFGITADDGAWLLVDGQVVAKRPGLHPTESATGVIKLGTGVHTISVLGFESTGNAYLAYDYRPPDSSSFIPVPDIFTGQARVGDTFSGSPLLAIGSDDFGGSGVARSRWSLNDGIWQENAGAILHVGQLQTGSYTLRYQAVDSAGNTGAVQQISFAVNAIPADLPYRIALPSISAP